MLRFDLTVICFYLQTVILFMRVFFFFYCTVLKYLALNFVLCNPNCAQTADPVINNQHELNIRHFIYYPAIGDPSEFLRLDLVSTQSQSARSH